MQELRGQGAFACWQALRDARADLDLDVPRGFGDCLEWSKRQFNAFFQVKRSLLGTRSSGEDSYCCCVQEWGAICFQSPEVFDC